jgi:hypothetical protein
MLGGYPAPATLRAVKNWPYDKAKELVYALKSVWYYEDYFTESEDCPGIFFASTGGWSGHEELIDAAQQNLMIWNAVYMAYRRGGHYILSTGYACYGGSEQFWASLSTDGTGESPVLSTHLDVMGEGK